MPWSCSLCILLFIYGAQVVQALPGPHKSICKWCTQLGGDVLQLDPLRLTVCLSLLDLVSKVDVLKGNVGLGPWKTSTALRWKSNYFRVNLCTLIAFLLLVEDFGEAMGLKGQLIPFWCLMPKGEKIRPKQEMDQLPLENFENSRVRGFCFLLWGECLIMGKRGSFWNLWSISLGIPLFMSLQVNLT